MNLKNKFIVHACINVDCLYDFSLTNKEFKEGYGTTKKKILEIKNKLLSDVLKRYKR